MNEQALKDRLQNIAREKKIRFNECWKKLLLERFLQRLSSSIYDRSFIFKGGFLLAYMMEIGRETIDLDFLLTHMEANIDEVKKVVMEIGQEKSTDGFLFNFEDIKLMEQPHMQYPGYRVTFGVSFGRMKDRIRIDVGTGDIVSPTSYELDLANYRGKPLFESQISLLVYPPETIFAEKLETALSKGAINSRMKDYHDLLLLTRSSDLIDLDKLQAAIAQTFHHRNTIYKPIAFGEQELKSLNKLWVAHLNGLGSATEKLNLPKNIQDTIICINEFLTDLTREHSIAGQD